VFFSRISDIQKSAKLSRITVQAASFVLIPCGLLPGRNKAAGLPLAGHRHKVSFQCQVPQLVSWFWFNLVLPCNCDQYRCTVVGGDVILASCLFNTVELLALLNSDSPHNKFLDISVLTITRMEAR